MFLIDFLSLSVKTPPGQITFIEIFLEATSIDKALVNAPTAALAVEERIMLGLGSIARVEVMEIILQLHFFMCGITLFVKRITLIKFVSMVSCQTCSSVSLNAQMEDRQHYLLKYQPTPIFLSVLETTFLGKF